MPVYVGRQHMPGWVCVHVCNETFILQYKLIIIAVWLRISQNTLQNHSVSQHNLQLLLIIPSKKYPTSKHQDAL